MSNYNKIVIITLIPTVFFQAQEIVCKKEKLWGIKTNFKKYEQSFTKSRWTYKEVKFLE
jgi:hypothetical protein